jgi:L-fucose/D-arabinose isomerase
MARIGLLSISDGRPYVHHDTTTFVRAAEDRLASALEAAGHDVVRAGELVTSNVWPPGWPGRSPLPGPT